uniref:B-box type zinc finger protein ncl-1 (inferred by orthology to a C. elegans protein) n=1 Tax=Strongyloides venezuelensis TaxID=75913 RepID=A0A0K0FZU0_STRVS
MIRQRTRSGMSESDSLACSAGSDSADPFGALLASCNGGFRGMNLQPYSNGMCTLGQTEQLEITQSQSALQDQDYILNMSTTSSNTPKKVVLARNYPLNERKTSDIIQVYPLIKNDCHDLDWKSLNSLGDNNNNFSSISFLNITRDNIRSHDDEGYSSLLYNEIEENYRKISDCVDSNKKNLTTISHNININFQNIKCGICDETYREPKVLACFHSFCKPCLELKVSERLDNILCPTCGQETQISPSLGVDGLLTDFGALNVAEQYRRMNGTANDLFLFGSPSSTSSSPPLSDSPGDHGFPIPQSVACTGCKSGERASAFCKDCVNFLCTACTQAHQYMHIFNGHRVEEIGTSKSTSPTGFEQINQCRCLEHKHQLLLLFCLTCNLAICHDCTIDHPQPHHDVQTIENVAANQIESMEDLILRARAKQQEVHKMFMITDANQNKLSESFQKAQNVINDNACKIMQLIQEIRSVVLTDLENAFSYKQLQLTLVDKENQKMVRKIAQTIDFTRRLLKNCSPAQIMVFKPLLDTRLQGFLNFNSDSNNVLQTACEIDYSPLNFSNARQAIINLMGSIHVPSDWSTPVVQNNNTSSVTNNLIPQQASSTPITAVFRPGSRNVRSPNNGIITMNGYNNSNPNAHGGGGHNNEFGSNNSLAAYSELGPASLPTLNSSFLNSNNHQYNNFPSSFPYEKWSTNIDSVMPSADKSDFDAGINTSRDMALLGHPSCNSPSFPPRSQVKRLKMSYHCKFGEFGVMEGQFTEPSGVAVNAQNQIIVADTNNHRIQVFDKDGVFKFQFGECGKRDGQLLYPNRVAVNRLTGDFIVTERSPTHQIQIYNHSGQFLRKFGANILQHPRGVCVDNAGRIIVVECKVMRVIIFDMYGNIIQKFSCSRYLEFPNGVCATDSGEIMISDNRAHCIKVFNYEGTYLRQIGGEGITNYPIGVGINNNGEVIVADNHNNFNLTVFSRQGELLHALESKVKHAQCFDVALVEDGSVVLASKDYRLYLYRYQQCGTNI